MLESERCIVFAVDKPNRDGIFECVEFFAFNEDFIPVENEQGESSYEACWPGIIKDPSQIAQPLSVQDHCHVSQSYASLEGRVYGVGGCIGGCDKCRHFRGVDCFSKSGDCWDAVNDRWTSLPQMNCGRERFHLHVFEGKLYAIGGSRRDDKCVFIERLDESDGQWTALPCPPPHVKLDCKRFVSAVIEHKGFMLFGSGSCESYYAYVPPETWICMDYLPFDRDILLEEPSRSPIVVDDHLLWLSGPYDSTITGFDINGGKYFDIDLVSEGLLPCDESHCYVPQLVYVGNGVLALVRSDETLHVLEGTGPTYGDFYDTHESFSSFCCRRFYIDFAKACAGEKCCVHVSDQRMFGPKCSQNIVAAFALDVAVVGNPSNSNINSILSRQKRKRKE